MVSRQHDVRNLSRSSTLEDTLQDLLLPAVVSLLVDGSSRPLLVGSTTLKEEGQITIQTVSPKLALRPNWSTSHNVCLLFACPLLITSLLSVPETIGRIAYR